MMPSEFSGVFIGRHGSGVKKSKPAMEKRRRARINASLAELRSLIPESVKRGNRRCSKMEKADILELAVSYLRHLQDTRNDKGPVIKTSYNLGFSECTQEVSEFFRSSSPATSTIKGTLLEHLNGCAPDHHPDSPSSSAAKSAPTSTNGSFKTSSIIARCLLSSTMVVTPEKISRYPRHSSTPAAVSSTSDADSSEMTLAVQDMAENNRLETGTELLKLPVNEALDVKRLEVFKVKKDLINSFNGETKENQKPPSQPGNHTANDNNLDQLSTTDMLQNNTELNNTAKELCIYSDKPDQVNSEEPINHDAVNVCNAPCPTKTNMAASLFDKQKEPLESDTTDHADKESSSSDILTQTNEKTEVKICSPETDANNNGSHISTAEKLKQLHSPSNKACSDFDSTAPRQLSDNPQEGSFTSLISHVIDNCISDKGIENQTQACTFPLKTFSTEPACSDSTVVSELQQESVSPDQIQHLFDNTSSPQEKTNKSFPTKASPFPTLPKMSFLVPAHIQPSLRTEVASLQQDFILKSPTRTDAITPVVHAPFTPKTTKLIEKIPTYDSFSPNSSASRGQLFISKSSHISELSPLQTKPHICLESSNARLLMSQTFSQTDIRESNTVPSVKTTCNKESIPPSVIFPCLTENTSNNKGNNMTTMKNTNSLADAAKTCNFSTNVLNPVNLTSITSFSRKRQHESVALGAKSNEHEKSPSENLDNPKKISLSPTNLLPSASCHDSGYKSETLREYMATKFRPIAPKNMTVQNVNSEDVNVFQQTGTVSQPHLKQGPVNNNVFASMSTLSNTFGQTSNVNIDKGHISNHNSFPFASNMEEHHLLAKCGDAKEPIPKSTKVDDILTMALKSNFPLDKTLFEARLNNFKQNKGTSFVQPETVITLQNEHLNQRQLLGTQTNQKRLSQSYNQHKSLTQLSTFTSIPLFEQQSQSCEAKGEGNEDVLQLMSSVDDRNVSVDSCGKSPLYNVSAILRELCHRCQLPDVDSRSSISEDSGCISSEYKRGYIAGTSRNLSPVSSEDGDIHMKTVKTNSFSHCDRDMKMEWWNSYQNDGDRDAKREKWNYSPLHDRDGHKKTKTLNSSLHLDDRHSDTKTERWNSFPKHDVDSQTKTKIWNSSQHNKESNKKTQTRNSSPHHDDRGCCIKKDRWNASHQSDRGSEIGSEKWSFTSLHDKDNNMKTEKWISSPVDLSNTQQRRSCTHFAEDVLETARVSFTESLQNKIAALDKNRTLTMNVQSITSNDIHVKHSMNTNNTTEKSPSTFIQPLNLSLHASSTGTTTRIFKDKALSDKGNSPGLDLSIRNYSKTSESPVNLFPDSSLQTSPQSSNEINSPPRNPHKQTSFKTDSRSQIKSDYFQNTTNLDNLPTLFSSFGFTHSEQSKHSKSHSKEYNLYQRTNTEYKTYIDTDRDSMSRNTVVSTFLNVAERQIELNNCSENMQSTPKTSLDPSVCTPSFNTQSTPKTSLDPSVCTPSFNTQSTPKTSLDPSVCTPNFNMQSTPKTSRDPSVCTPSLNHNCRLLPERSMKTSLHALPHVYHNPADTAGISDDVWRPW